MDPGTATRQYQRSTAANGSATAAEWTTLLGRMLEDLSRVIQLELQLVEARIAPALVAMADRAIAGLVMVCAGVIAGACLLAALILLLHIWLQWWECFAIAGVVALICALVARTGMKSPTAQAETNSG